MAETSKARARREREGWFDKYIQLDKPGIDIGAGSDPLNEVFRRYDVLHGDGDAQTMAGIPDESFYTVYASHVLEHLHDPIEALRNWWRILAPGGYLIVQVPHMDLYEKKTDLPSRWNADHKTYWIPAILFHSGDNPNYPSHVRGLDETLYAAIGDKAKRIEYLTVLDEGYAANGDSHPGGEYSIEACIYKVPQAKTAERPAPIDRASEQEPPLRNKRKRKTL